MKEALGLIALIGIGVFFYNKYRNLRKQRNVKLQKD